MGRLNETRCANAGYKHIQKSYALCQISAQATLDPSSSPAAGTLSLAASARQHPSPTQAVGGDLAAVAAAVPAWICWHATVSLCKFVLQLWRAYAFSSLD